MLHAEHTDFVPGGQARVRIRHVQANTLLAHDNRTNVDLSPPPQSMD
jgi:hypothetical protein